MFWIHLVLVVLATAFFLYSFIKEKKIYQLLFVIWIPLTLLTYVSTNKVFLILLGVVQLIFFFLVIFFLFRNPNKKKGAYQAMLEELDSYGAEESESAESAEEVTEAEPASVEEPTAEAPAEEEVE